MADNPFERLSEIFNVLPGQIQEAYEEATIETIDQNAEKLKNFLRANSGSATLNAQMVENVRKTDHVYYEREITWDDTKIVNIEQGKGVGRDINKPRAKGKRNFSLHPATYKDLAYIINHGHGGKSGNSFIQRGVRRISRWRKDRDIAFEKKLNEISEEFKEE